MRNIKAISPYEVLFAVDKGVAYYNSKSLERKVLVREPDSRFIMTTFDSFNDLISMGSYDGKIYIYSLSKQKYEHKAFEITHPTFEG
jgi:hypothetical protein